MSCVCAKKILSSARPNPELCLDKRDESHDDDCFSFFCSSGIGDHQPRSISNSVSTTSTQPPQEELGSSAEDIAADQDQVDGQQPASPLDNRRQVLVDSDGNYISSEERQVIDQLETIKDNFEQATTTRLEADYSSSAEFDDDKVRMSVKPSSSGLVAAIRAGLVDIASGKLKDGTTLSEATAKGLLEPQNSNEADADGMSLCDALRKGLVDPRSGKVTDRFTGKSVKLSDAIKRGLLNPNKLEIYDTSAMTKITLKEALDKTIIDDATGKYNKQMSLNEALKKNYIYNAMTLKECDDNELMTNTGGIKEPISQKTLSLLDAIANGILDADLKSVKDVASGQYVSLGHALTNGIVSVDGKFTDTATKEVMTLVEAVKRGNLTTVSQKSIFDIEGIKDQNTGDYISFNKALETGAIDKVTGKFVDLKTKHKISFTEAAEKDLLQPQLLEMLKKPIGIYSADKKRELSLLEAVSEGLIDPHSGLLINTATTNTVPMDKALQLQLITHMGVAVLKSLLNITVTTATVTQTVKRFIQVSSADRESGAITFQEALRRGLIDDSTGIFTHPDTGKELLLDEAIHLGLLKLSPTSSLKSSPVASSEARRSPDKFLRGDSPDKSRSSPKRTIKSSPIRKDSKVESLQTSFDSTNESSSQVKSTVSSSKSSTIEVKKLSSSSATSASNVQENGIKNGHTARSASADQATKSSSKSSSATNTTSKSSSLTRKASSRASSRESTKESSAGFRSIPIVVVGGGMSKSTPASPTKSALPPTLTSQKSQSLDIPDMPAGGYTLKEAIDYRLFDPQTGLFNNSTPFGEAVASGLISPTSATVATTDENGKGITITLRRGLELSVLDNHAKYNDGRKLISMHEAIMNGKIWHVWKSAAQRSAIARSTSRAEKKKSANVVQISKGILFNKDTNSFEFSKDITAADLLAALKVGKIRPQDIQVQNSKGHGNLNILEAMQQGVIDKATGEYTARSCKTMTLLEAIHAGYIVIVSAPGLQVERPQTIDLIGTPSIRDGTIKARIVESGVTTTRISTFMVEVPGTGEEVTLEEAVKRGLVSEETAALYREEVSTDSKVQSVVILITDPATGIEMRSEEAIAKGIVTEEEVQEFLRMKEQGNQTSTKMTTTTKSKKLSPDIQRTASTMSKASSKKSSSSSSSSSTSSSDEADNGSYRSELTIDLGNKSPEEDIKSIKQSESATHTVRTNIVNLTQGYALSNIDEVRHLITGETMSIYEAKLRGIATDVKEGRSEFVTHQLKLFVTEAVAKGLINFARGTFTNPSTGEELSIGEAIKLGLLITDFTTTQDRVVEINAPQISLSDAFHHCFDVKSRKFTRTATKESYTLQQSVEQDWINGQDIIFDVTSSSQCTLKKALEVGLINGQSCEIKVDNEYIFMMDAAKQGLVAVFPEAVPELDQSEVTYSLRETIENGVFHKETHTFVELLSQQHITIFQALRTGLVDFRSAEVTNTLTNDCFNLMEAIEQKIVDEKTCRIRDVKAKKEVTLLEAYESGLLKDVERDAESPFDVISFWDALDREQLDPVTGMFYSAHEEKKTMTLEEAVYRRYIEKKSALVKDTWKRKYCSLSEASRKKIIKDGRVMNTTTGKYVTVQEAIKIELILREIKNVSLIDMLDFGMYLPHSGRIDVPGLDREMTLGEAVDLKLIDHTRTIVKSRKSNRYISLYEAIKVEGVIDSMTGMYAGSMNLLEARSKGYLLSIDAMVCRKVHQLLPGFKKISNYNNLVNGSIKFFPGLIFV